MPSDAQGVLWEFFSQRPLNSQLIGLFLNQEQVEKLHKLVLRVHKCSLFRALEVTEAVGWVGYSSMDSAARKALKRFIKKPDEVLVALFHIKDKISDTQMFIRASKSKRQSLLEEHHQTHQKKRFKKIPTGGKGAGKGGGKRAKTSQQ